MDYKREQDEAALSVEVKVGIFRHCSSKNHCR
jgi:hypothetical protein